MKLRNVVLVFSSVLVCGTVTDVHAGRGIPIPIVWGSSEKMTELGELPPEAAGLIREELGESVTVAFLYERTHVFYGDLWTWNGRYVLHSGDKYWELNASQWKQLIGTNPSAMYGKPILYRIPLLSTLILITIFGYVAGKQWFKSDQETLTELMGDKRYQESIEILFGEENDEESATVATSLDEQKFMKAKDQLISGGVHAQTAEANLRRIAETILTKTNARIDAYLELASQLDHQGDWKESADVYSQVIGSLPDTDDRKAYARNCLASIMEKQAANAAGQTEPSDPA